MDDRRIRIGIVHRDGLYRDSLGHCLVEAEPISIVHSASELKEETWKAVITRRADLLILEFGLCRRSRLTRSAEGLHTTALGIKTIVVGVPNREEDILACIESEGAAGYVVMDSSLNDLISNIHAVMKGEALCSPRVASLAFNRVFTLTRRTDANQPVISNGICLTRREGEIVRLIDDGLSNKEIAARLHIEVSTVKNHVHNVLDKLRVHNRYSAVKFIRNQVIHTGHSQP